MMRSADHNSLAMCASWRERRYDETLSDRSWSGAGDGSEKEASAVWTPISSCVENRMVCDSLKRKLADSLRDWRKPCIGPFLARGRYAKSTQLTPKLAATSPKAAAI